MMMMKIKIVPFGTSIRPITGLRERARTREMAELRASIAAQTRERVAQIDREAEALGFAVSREVKVEHVAISSAITEPLMILPIIKDGKENIKERE